MSASQPPRAPRPNCGNPSNQPAPGANTSVCASGTKKNQDNTSAVAAGTRVSPAPRNEIAFAARSGPGFDIKVYDLATGQTRQLTFGEGTNESPAYSPNGRHIAFTTTRYGRVQVATMTWDGRDVKQVTRDGNNWTPSWSN